MEKRKKYNERNKQRDIEGYEDRDRNGEEEGDEYLYEEGGEVEEGEEGEVLMVMIEGIRELLNRWIELHWIELV